MTDSPAPHFAARPEGLYLPDLEAWIDPSAAVARAILSHGHADHAAAGHGEIWATAETLSIYRLRHPAWQGTARALAYGETVNGAVVSLALHRAGHILGAAQIRVEGPEGSTLYTGDFRRRASRTTLPAVAPAADVLVMESTFGLPVFRFPAREDTEARLVAECRRAAEDGSVAIVLAYALGKSQDAVLALTEAGIPTVLHGAAWKLLPAYERAGFAFPLSRPYRSGPARPGEVLVVPPNCVRTPVVRKLKKRRILYLSGWALREASRAEFDADLLLPISDHADFDELLAHASAVAPVRIRTHHGYARDLARILGLSGKEALALAEGGERTREDAEEEPETPGAPDTSEPDGTTGKTRQP